MLSLPRENEDRAGAGWECWQQSPKGQAPERTLLIRKTDVGADPGKPSRH